MKLLQTHCEEELERMPQEELLEKKDKRIRNAINTLLGYLEAYRQAQIKTTLERPSEVNGGERIYKTCQVNVPDKSLHPQTFVIDRDHFEQCIEGQVLDLTRVRMPKKGSKLVGQFKDFYHWKVGKKERVFAKHVKNNEI